MYGSWNAFRHSFRRILGNPGFTLVVALTLALGIGANAAILSVVNGVLLRELPYEDPDRLVTVFHHFPSLNDLHAPVSAQGFRRYQEESSAFDGLAVESGASFTLTGHGEAERISASRVSGEYFSTLGVPPALGRWLTPADDEPGRDRVVVLAHGSWQRLFGGEVAAVGRTLVLDGESYEVVGVMPAGFRSFWNRDAELWKPLALTSEQLASGNEYLALSARLAAGVSFAQAQADFDLVTRGIHEEFPGAYPDDWKLLVRTLNEQARGDVRPAILVLMGAVGLVLLIACANVANLFLARAAARQREVALCQALGASRARIVGQVLAESLILALTGGAAGLALAFFGLRLFVAATVERFAESVAFDATVVSMTAGVTLVAAVAAGVVPALLSTGRNLVEPLREGGRGVAWDRQGKLVRGALVVLEMAVALVLLVGSGLLVRSFLLIRDVDPGFRAEGLLTGGVALPAAKYAEPEEQRAFFADLFERIGALPGVRAAGGTSVLPFGGSWSTATVIVEGYQPPPDSPSPWGDVRMVTPDFLQALSVPLLQGRPFARSDGPEAPRVVIVDEELVRRYLPDQDPIGKRLAFPTSGEPEWMEIVGVVGHTMHEGLDAEARIQLYLPFAQFPRRSLSLAVRTAGDPITAVGAVRGVLASLDADVPFSDVRAMDARVEESLGSRRFTTLLLGVFSALALLLAAVGVYGVMSYSVAQRTREMGVRLALGAARGRVLGLVLRHGLALAVLGGVIGMASAFGLTRLMASQLFGVGATDAATFVVAVLVLMGSAAAATLVPAARATRLDPAEVLREE
jgi:putative ABC transport system permease protein